MIGSGVMALPWAFHQAGMVLGSLICFFSFVFSVWTCLIAIKINSPQNDFYDTMRIYWGPFGYYLSVIGTLALALTASTSYFIIMAQMLYPITLAIL